MKKDSEIICVIKDPGERPIVASIPNTLEALQKAVDGYIETVTIASNLVLICNEEGRLLDLPDNCTVCGVSFVGSILAAGVNRDTFISLTPDQIRTVKYLFNGLEHDLQGGNRG